MNTGIAFEHWMVDLYKDLGIPRVRHNILKKKRGTTSQFDIVYGLYPTYYVECKYKSDEYTTPFSEVATFAAKLELFNISYKRGIIVTNQEFDKRSRVYARKTGIRLIDNKRLLQLHKQRLPFWKQFNKTTLEEVLHKDLKLLSSL